MLAMKITAVLGILLFVGTPFITLASLPTEEQVQGKLNAAIAKADHVVIEHHWMPWIPVEREKIRDVRLHEISSKPEILALATFVSVRIPPAVRTVVGEQEEWSRSAVAVDTPESFEIILSEEGKVLLSFDILGADCIGSQSLLEDSAIRVDKESLAPFYNRLKLFLNIREANQAPVLPKPMSVTLPTVQEACQQ